MRWIERLLAEFVLLFHLGVVFIVLFGWLFPTLEWLYVSTLIATLASQLILGHCFLSKWEFFFRKRYDPSVAYDASFSSYYTEKLLGLALPARLVYIMSVTFLIASLVIVLLF